MTIAVKVESHFRQRIDYYYFYCYSLCSFLLNWLWFKNIDRHKLLETICYQYAKTIVFVG